MVFGTVMQFNLIFYFKQNKPKQRLESMIHCCKNQKLTIIKIHKHFVVSRSIMWKLVAVCRWMASEVATFQAEESPTGTVTALGALFQFTWCEEVQLMTNFKIILVPRKYCTLKTTILLLNRNYAKNYVACDLYNLSQTNEQTTGSNIL